MSAELELRWLKKEKHKGAVKRFTEFCKEDIVKQASQKGFDIDKYQEAVKVVIHKLDNSFSVEELFSPESAEEASNAD